MRKLLVSFLLLMVATVVDAQPKADILFETSSAVAWRGERVGLKAELITRGGLGEPVSLRLTALNKVARRWQSEALYVDSVLTDSFNTCGHHPKGLKPFSVADCLRKSEMREFGAAMKQGLWCMIEVPRECRRGTYGWKLELVGSKSGRVLVSRKVQLIVLERTLPPVEDYAFHTDFWQQPYSVARFYDVPKWSQRHFDLLRPYLKLLARSGQKVVSTILFYEPWGEQSEDKFGAMVKTTRNVDATWSFDYSIFDHWVELADSCGIREQINCFSMVPWDMTFRYFDAFLGSEVDLKTKTDSEAYRSLWTAFLKSFAQHLKDKGWYDKTCIAMDERGLASMLDAYRIAQEAVPGIKMALAGNYHEQLVEKLYDYCIPYAHSFPKDERARRANAKQVTTFYTCCTEQWPNLFSNSKPVEAVILPLYAVANGFDGYLHWSWMNWNATPETDTRYRLFGSGDTFCIYPGPSSSVRYESFIQGVQLAEKVRFLKSQFEKNGAQEQLHELAEIMKSFENEHITREGAPEAVARLIRWVNGPLR